MKRLFSLPLAAALAVVIGLAGATFLSPTHAGPDGVTFQACVDQAGNIRLLGPQIKGDFNTRCKDNETLIEFPSSQRIAVLEAGLSSLQSRVSGVETGLSGLQSRVSGVETRLSSLERRVSALEAGGGGAPPPSCGCVLWLKMDEGSGSIANDSSGLGNNGTVFGASWAAGKAGTALSFDGINDYVNVNASFGTLLSFSAEAWINTTTAGGTIYSERVAGTGKNNWFNLHLSGGSLALEIWDTAINNQVTKNSNVNVANGTWHHVAAVISGNNLSLYVDGALALNANFSHAAATPNNQAAIGSRYTDVGSRVSFFSGSIDSLRLYDRALSAAEISTHFLNPS